MTFPNRTFQSKLPRAGQDTTAAALSWLVKYLPQDINIRRRLHDEVCGVFGPSSDESGPLDSEALSGSERVPVLEAVVVESPRRAQIAPNVVRELVNDEMILGGHILKGTQLLIPVESLSAQESDWGPDAESWRPSRWLRKDGSFDGAAGLSFPFGLGQRASFGQRLAMLQLKTFVAALSRVFIFKPLPEEVGGLRAVTVSVTRQPELCYVSLERWPAEQDGDL